MNNVEFEENNFSVKNFSEPAPKLARWIISHGLAKDVAGANRIEIFASIVFFALAIYFFFF